MQSFLHLLPQLAALAIVDNASAQSIQPPGATVPVAQPCGTTSNVICINRYGSVLPYHFNLTTSTAQTPPDFRNTSVPADSSFGSIAKADFVVFDSERGLQYLGSQPSYEFVFKVSDAVHEAPVYVPQQNWLYLSQLAPPPGYLPQLVVNLNKNPPELFEYVPNPPVYAPNGGTFRHGQIIFGASGGNNSIGGGEQRVSIRSVDPQTNQSVVLLNNYYGAYFNTIDDLAAHPVTGDIFFTDPTYSWFNALTDTPPQLPPASWRFVPETGATMLIDDSLKQPNGIAFTPDGQTLYISDTGAIAGDISTSGFGSPSVFNTTGARAVYAWDVTCNGTRISNKRPFYLASSFVPDGLKVSREGLVLTAAGHGVDVVDDAGQLILRIQTNYTVQNFAWVGPDLKEFWLMGNGGISRVRWNIQGQELR